jgi:hypothetical protein
MLLKLSNLELSVGGVSIILEVCECSLGRPYVSSLRGFASNSLLLS